MSAHKQKNLPRVSHLPVYHWNDIIGLLSQDLAQAADERLRETIGNISDDASYVLYPGEAIATVLEGAFFQAKRNLYFRETDDRYKSAIAEELYFLHALQPRDGSSVLVAISTAP